jgi:hypothetical protein
MRLRAASELERIFDKFFNVTNVLEDFSAKISREDTSTHTIGIENLYGISNNNIYNIKTSLSKVLCSHITTLVNILGRLQMGNPTITSTIF